MRASRGEPSPITATFVDPRQSRPRGMPAMPAAPSQRKGRVERPAPAGRAGAWWRLVALLVNTAHRRHRGRRATSVWASITFAFKRAAAGALRSGNSPSLPSCSTPRSERKLAKRRCRCHNTTTARRPEIEQRNSTKQTVGKRWRRKQNQQTRALLCSCCRPTPPPSPAPSQPVSRPAAGG